MMGQLVARLAEHCDRRVRVRELRLLHEHHVRPGALEPPGDLLQTRSQRVHVPGRDPHDMASLQNSRATTGPRPSYDRTVPKLHPPMKLTIRPVTPERWPDLEAIFNARGCSIARGCWCMCYRRSGARPPLPRGMTRAKANRAD